LSNSKIKIKWSQLFTTLIAEVVIDYKKIPSTDRQNIITDSSSMIILENKVKGLVKIKTLKRLKRLRMLN